jgi:hypothetical protein
MNQENAHQQAQSLLTIEISADQVNRQMELILDSRHFRQNKSLEKFLRYVVAKKISGEEGELKEFTIGLEVFQRGADYDPRKDAVVRVQANVLRKRLAGYYEEEGAQDEIVIEMPKGHYVPQFQRRAESCDSTHAPARENETALACEQINSGALTDFHPQIPSSGRRARWKTLALIAATFMLGLGTAVAWQNYLGERVLARVGVGRIGNANGASAKSAIDPAYMPLWEKFLEPGAENVLAYGTPQFFVGKGLFLRDVQVNSPAEAESAAQLLAIEKTFHQPLKPTEVYTGVGETHGVHLLTRFFDKSSGNLRVTRSRMVGWDEMRKANVIFLSSMRFHTLAKELPYPSDFSISQGSTSRIVNLRPRAGELEAYGDGDNVVYAVITVWPGKLLQRRILILSGSTTWATLAAAEYVTDPDYMRQLNQHLEQCRTQTGQRRHAPFFQALLRAEVKDNQPISINYVTHHDLEINDPAQENKENIARLTAPRN